MGCMSRQLINALKQADIITQAPVRLRSGQRAEFYIDIKKACGDPVVLKQMVDGLADPLDSHTTCLAATGYGGLPLASGLSLASQLPLVLVRDAPKQHGTSAGIDGYQPGSWDRVAIIDDVLTSGSSLRHTMEVVHASGAHISGCYAVIKRGEGEIPAPLHYLATASDLV